MSKTVKIPDNMHPFWCVINGVKYGPWPAGLVQNVPDEVAALIEAIDAASPEEDPPETEEEMAVRVAERVASKIADEKIAAALEDYSNYIDLTNEAFTLGTAAPITSALPKKVAEDIIGTAFIKPTGCAVKISATEYELAAVGQTGDHLIFSSPVTSSSGTVTSIVTFELYIEGPVVYGLLQQTLLPE